MSLLLTYLYIVCGEGTINYLLTQTKKEIENATRRIMNETSECEIRSVITMTVLLDEPFLLPWYNNRPAIITDDLELYVEEPYGSEEEKYYQANLKLNKEHTFGEDDHDYVDNVPGFMPGTDLLEYITIDDRKVYLMPFYQAAQELSSGRITAYELDPKLQILNGPNTIITLFKGMNERLYVKALYNQSNKIIYPPV